MTGPRDEESSPPGGGETGGPLERREIFFSGHVQGVGFRYTARSIAASLPIVGWVSNLPDGRVQLVAEGTRADLDELVERLEGEMGRYIRGKEVRVSRASGEFSSFDVVR